MNRVFLTKTFSRWMRKSNVTEDSICSAVSEMSNGLIDADLGGNIFKKRVAVNNKGKRAGARTIVATQLLDRWFFLYGFEKNERSNISKEELKLFQELGSDFLGLNDSQLKSAMLAGNILEVCNGNNSA